MKLRAIALALCAGAAGCATIARGTAEDFTVESTPTGATIQTSNGFECASTPCTFHMQRKNGFTVTASKEGYQTATATVTSSMSGGGGAGFAGNVLAGGLIGMGIDAQSGAMNDLKPNPLHIDLTPMAPVVAATADVTTPPTPVDASAPQSPPATEAATPAATATTTPVATTPHN